MCPGLHSEEAAVMTFSPNRGGCRSSKGRHTAMPTRAAWGSSSSSVVPWSESSQPYGLYDPVKWCHIVDFHVRIINVLTFVFHLVCVLASRPSPRNCLPGEIIQSLSTGFSCVHTVPRYICYFVQRFVGFTQVRFFSECVVMLWHGIFACITFHATVIMIGSEKIYFRFFLENICFKAVLLHLKSIMSITNNGIQSCDSYHWQKPVNHTVMTICYYCVELHSANRHHAMATKGN